MSANSAANTHHSLEKITTLHVSQRDILSACYFSDVLDEASAQCPLTFGGAPGRLPDANQPLLEVERVDPACRWPNTLF
jgi:hypothetical protein